MIRQLIILFFATYIVCSMGNKQEQQQKIGAVLDKICATRSRAASRIDKEKSDKVVAERDNDAVDDAEDNGDSQAPPNENSNRKMYYVGRRAMGDSDESSDENANSNVNVNVNKRRPIIIASRRFLNDEPPNRESRRRMVNGFRRNLPRY